MTYAQLKDKFPHASESFLRRNSDENKISSKISHAEQRERTQTLAVGHGRETPRARLPHICFTLCRHKLLDCDAKWASVKDLLDGCWRSGIVDGDREDQITLEVRQEKVPQSEEELTIIEIDLP